MENCIEGALGSIVPNSNKPSSPTCYMKGSIGLTLLIMNTLNLLHYSMDEWKIVSRKSKNRIKTIHIKTCSQQFKLCLEFDARISFTKSFLQSDPNFPLLLPYLEQYSEIISIGLGNFSTSLNSCTQQALFELLIETLSIPSIQLYDPQFTVQEISYLHAKNYSVGEYFTSQLAPSIYYMVHCHYDLYQTFLTSPAHYSYVIIGNNINSPGRFQSIPFPIKDPAFEDTYINIPLIITNKTQ